MSGVEKLNPSEIIESGECAIGRNSPTCLKKDEEEILKAAVEKMKIIRRHVDARESLKKILSEANFKDVKSLLNAVYEKSIGTPLEKEVARIRELAFKPDGPADNNIMMDSFLLIKLGMQLQENFDGVEFGGVLTYDFMINPFTSVYGDPKKVYESYLKKKWDRLQFILNTDHRMGIGKHWVAMIVNMRENQIQYADSFGDPPLSGLLKSTRAYPGITDEKGRFLSFLRDWIYEVSREFIFHGIPMTPVYSDLATQSSNDNVNCGVYSILTLVLNAKGIDFKTANSQHITTNKIKEIRGLLFSKIPNYRPVLPLITPERVE